LKNTVAPQALAVFLFWSFLCSIRVDVPTKKYERLYNDDCHNGYYACICYWLSVHKGKERAG
jgi:hypothetical protein